MGSFSLIHWLIVGAIVLLLFGGGSRLSGIGKGLGEGIKNFKKGLKDEDGGEDPKRLEADNDEKPKKIAAKKVITVEVDEADDEDAIRRKIAAQKKVASAED